MKFEEVAVGDILIGNISGRRYEVLAIHSHSKAGFIATDEKAWRVTDWNNYTKVVPEFEIGKWYKNKSIYYPATFKVVEIRDEEIVTIYQDTNDWHLQVLYIGNDASNYEEVASVR